VNLARAYLDTFWLTARALKNKKIVRIKIPRSGDFLLLICGAKQSNHQTSSLQKNFFMIKLCKREMKSLSRILTVCLCCVPVFGANSSPVATTSGSNLTAYNPSNVNNNQWAMISNARYDGSGSAKVDFGNCNALILRCAQPKCGNGGCVDANVAGAIVSGCIKANDKCKQYGDDLANYMTAQLVANSNAKINEQKAAQEQARIQAEAQAAAASAQSEQISQMQNQMYQMQQQMAQQQAESAAALQEALAQQQAQSAAAIENMRNAATDAAKQTEAGVSAYQQEAIARGISQDVLTRQQITGQIQTEIEDAEVSLTAMKKSMQNSFNYAGCDARGNNCTGPRRIKKWRELASGFITPYDTTIDKIYDALDTARMVGVDLTQIYAMLDDSCNSWSQYLCPAVGNNHYITYGYTKNGEYIQDSPRVCKSDLTTILDENTWKQCRPCTWLKPVTESDEIYAGWIETENEAKEQQRVVACSSSALDTNSLFARRARQKKGKGIVDIDLLEKWITQTEPNKVSDTTSHPRPQDYCAVSDVSTLESLSLSKKVDTSKNSNYNNLTFCVDQNGAAFKKTDGPDDCPYINPVFAICDTHPYNAGKDATWTQGSINSSEQEEMNRIISLKITVVSQQMYKQYEYLNATLRKLKTQLQKAVLTTNLEAAGANSEDSDKGSSGSNRNSQYRDCSGKTMQGTLDCLRENYSSLAAQINSKKCTRAEKDQLKKDTAVFNSILKGEKEVECDLSTSGIEACKTCLTNYNGGLINLDREIANDEANRRGGYR